MASAAQDTFTIGTPLENNHGNVDILNVHANAYFKNNIELGSSSADTVVSNAPITASSGIFLQNSNLFLTGNSTIFVNGQDILSGGGNNEGGGNDFANQAVFEEFTSYEPYGGGTGSYFSGTVIRDASNSSQGRIEIGHISASDYQTDSDVIRLQTDQSRIIVYNDNIKFEYGNNGITVSEIYDSVYGQGGGSNVSSVESTGSGISLLNNYQNDIVTLKSISGDQDRITVQNYNNNTEIKIFLDPQKYDYSVVIPETSSIGANTNFTSEVFYLQNQGNSSQNYHLISAQSFLKRVITIKNISSQYNVIVNASGSETIDGNSSLTIAVNHCYVLHAADNNGYKWYIIGHYA